MNYSFSGCRNNKGETIVLVCDGNGYYANLPKYLDEVNHSPDGFNWGYGGSGPAQLAYALLRFFAEREFANEMDSAELKEFARDIASKFHHDFMLDFVSGFSDSWKITGKDIERWLVENTAKEDD